MTLRPARAEEAPVLSEIAHAAKRHWGYPESWIAAWRGALTITPELLARQTAVVAEGDGAVRGFYALLADGAVWTLEHLWVRPEWIGSGLGRALFEDAVRAARAGGAAVVEIEADPNAEAFYRHMGARRVGEVRADVEGSARTLPLLRLELAGG